MTDEDRAVRLTTAKLFVALVQSEPTVVLPAVNVLAHRLADEEEFYYVRARCAEALGYVGVEAPEAVTDPETLADFRIVCSIDAVAGAQMISSDGGDVFALVSVLDLNDDSDTEESIPVCDRVYEP